MRNALRNTKVIVSDEIKLPGRCVHCRLAPQIVRLLVGHMRSLAPTPPHVLLCRACSTFSVTEVEPSKDELLLYNEVSTRISAGIRALIKAGSIMRWVCPGCGTLSLPHAESESPCGTWTDLCRRYTTVIQLLNVLRQAGKVLEANNLLKRGGYDSMGAWVVWLGCMCGCATAAARRTA